MIRTQSGGKTTLGKSHTKIHAGWADNHADSGRGGGAFILRMTADDSQVCEQGGGHQLIAGRCVECGTERGDGPNPSVWGFTAWRHWTSSSWTHSGQVYLHSNMSGLNPVKVTFWVSHCHVNSSPPSAYHQKQVTFRVSKNCTKACGILLGLLTHVNNLTAIKIHTQVLGCCTSACDKSQATYTKMSAHFYHW